MHCSTLKESAASVHVCCNFNYFNVRTHYLLFVVGDVLFMMCCLLQRCWDWLR